jgi:hypothetical protein
MSSTSTPTSSPGAISLSDGANSIGQITPLVAASDGGGESGGPTLDFGEDQEALQQMAEDSLPQGNEVRAKSLIFRPGKSANYQQTLDAAGYEKQTNKDLTMSVRAIENASLKNDEVISPFSAHFPSLTLPFLPDLTGHGQL